ncbi:MAG: apolipoprotein N-acyltransferase [Spirochaetes bacterium]|nr:MAG: apolipoprotein N-acyltransferase [Spirochaetota bacterium]
MKSNSSVIRKFFTEIGLLLLSSVVFSLSFPSFISDRGFGVLSFVSIIPVFIVVHRSSWKSVFFYGSFYGFVTYAIFNYWLSTFHPLAIVIVPIIYLVYFLILFPVLKLADKLFPRNGYLVQIFLWISYEYLRTKGFLGYPYGNIGYALSFWTPFIQSASFLGSWGISFLVLFPSAFLGNALKEGRSGFMDFIKEQKRIAVIYTALFVVNLVYGAVVMQDYSGYPAWKVALIQHNSDSWKGGIRTYEKNFRILKRLSLEAVKENPDIVIWSETSFVPGVDWHSKYRTDKERYALVKDLEDFLATQKIPYVIGNDDGQLKDPALPPVLPDGSYNRKDYNATFLYEDGELKQTYRKIQLVPFTENFPYKKTFPKFYQLLVDHDYHFWEKGTEYTVFNARGVKFSTPICYEDVFGYISRNFVKRGAQVIVNLTNDSWSGAVSAEMQHMQMAVFRAIENRRSVVRSTNSGMTVLIDPDGRILKSIEPFKEGYLVGDVPIYNAKTTFYTKMGNWFAFVSIALSVFLLGLGIISYIRQIIIDKRD